MNQKKNRYYLNTQIYLSTHKIKFDWVLNENEKKFLGEKPKGWKLVQTLVPQIIELGVAEGIIQSQKEKVQALNFKPCFFAIFILTSYE